MNTPQELRSLAERLDDISTSIEKMWMDPDLDDLRYLALIELLVGVIRDLIPPVVEDVPPQPRFLGEDAS